MSNYLFEDIKEKFIFDKHSKVISIVSGKNNVGKTTLACNLAIALAQEKKHVLVVDIDLSFSNLSMCFDVHSPLNLKIKDVLLSGKSFNDIIVKTNYGVDLIFGGFSDCSISDLEKEEREKINNIFNNARLLYDIIIFDISLGNEMEDIISFCEVSDLCFVVLTPDLTDIIDAYALIKFMNNKLPEKEKQIIINCAKNKKQAEYFFEKINNCTKKFLFHDFHTFYWIVKKEYTRRDEEPLIEKNNKCEFSKQINHIASDIKNKINMENLT